MKNFVSANRLNNSDKMDTFPETHKLPKFIQEEKLKSPIAIQTNKQTNKHLEILSLDGSTSDFHQTFKDEINKST